VPSRRKTREFVLQVLFAADAQEQDPAAILPFLADHFGMDDERVIRMDRIMQEFARELLAAVSRDKEAIDDLIARLSHHWKLHRMNRVDRNILRMAIAEILTFADIPLAVTLNEAIDLGKKYGAENSSAFINGILDRMKSAKSPGLELAGFRESLGLLDEPTTTD